MIKAIIFDYSGVIVKDESNSLDKVIEYLGTNKETWDREWFLGNKETNTGKKPYQEYFLEICSKFKDLKNSKDQILEILEEKKNGYRINTELIELIKELKNKGYKIGLISNYGIELRDKIKNDGIHDLFDTIIISAEVNCQKPEPEIFQLAFSKLDIKSEEAVFIDDASKCLENSESIGYYPVLYKDNQSLKQELEKILKIKL